MQRTTIALILALAVTANLQAGTDWTQFRGPKGNGHSDAKGLPTKWGEDSNIKWKTAIHGRAWSSPIILGDQVWLTTATADGKQLGVVVVDKDSGKIVFDKKLFDVADPQFAHKFNSYASPTPVAEDGRVYVTWGSPATACLDAKTFKIIWERRDLVCDHFRGAGSSPIIFRNLLINNYDGADVQYVIAFDKQTGKTVWKTDRSVDFKDLGPDGKPHLDGDTRKAYSTPHIAWLGKRPLLLSSGAKAHYAYNPVTGKEIWRIDHHGQHSASTRPLSAHGNAYFPTGFSKSEVLVVSLKSKRSVNPDDLVWRSKRSIPKKPSLLMVKDLLFMVDDGGIASCYEGKTGELLFQERLATKSGNFSASPIYANGNIYISNENGKSFVFRASREFKVIATNELEDGCMASPAVSGNALFLRTKTHLYRIEK
jgi:outer membrane protein assembly factor BamB